MKWDLGSKQTKEGDSSHSSGKMSIRSSLLLLDDRSYVGSSLDRFTGKIH